MPLIVNDIEKEDAAGHDEGELLLCSSKLPLSPPQTPRKQSPAGAGPASVTLPSQPSRKKDILAHASSSDSEGFLNGNHEVSSGEKKGSDPNATADKKDPIVDCNNNIAHHAVVTPANTTITKTKLNGSRAQKESTHPEVIAFAPRGSKELASKNQLNEQDKGGDKKPPSKPHYDEESFSSSESDDQEEDEDYASDGTPSDITDPTVFDDMSFAQANNKQGNSIASRGEGYRRGGTVASQQGKRYQQPRQNPYDWIKKGQPYQVEYGPKSMTYEAIPLGPPYQAMDANSNNLRWWVDIRWDWWEETAEVWCSRVVNPNDSKRLRCSHRSRSATKNGDNNRRIINRRNHATTGEYQKGCPPQRPYPSDHVESGRQRQRRQPQPVSKIQTNGMRKRGRPPKRSCPTNNKPVSSAREQSRDQAITKEHLLGDGTDPRNDSTPDKKRHCPGTARAPEEEHSQAIVEQPMVGDDGTDPRNAITSDKQRQLAGAESAREENSGQPIAQQALVDDETESLESAIQAMQRMPTVTREEARQSLKEVGKPYPIQEAMHRVQAARSPFQINIGDKVVKSFHGKKYVGYIEKEYDELGEVDGRLVELWRVRYEDDDEEDMELEEILRYIQKPNSKLDSFDRTLRCLELFCGRAIVSEAFCKREWSFAAVDSAPESNATIRMNILDMDPERHLEFVPDFIWASPMCTTHSNAGGGTHRTVQPGSYNLSPESRYHDKLFTKMAEIMMWARTKHPHLVVVIENPVGNLHEMPLMKELEESLEGLEKVKVHYCAFGRDEKKPTYLWSNSRSLRNHLRDFICEKRCMNDGEHVGTRKKRAEGCDVGAIPENLAREVARYVDSMFVLDERQHRFKPASQP